MRALVVYESMFGNTQAIAEAVAEGLRAQMSVDVGEVGAVSTYLPFDVALLVVGGPTHAFGLSRPSTRKDACARSPSGAVVSAGIGLREWLERVDVTGPRPVVATFDTRIRRPRLPGSAAKAAGKRLGRRLGLRQVVPAESFWVDGTTGPLCAGELERARAWGSSVGASAASQRLSG